MTTSYTTQELHNQGLNQSILFYIGKSAKGNFEIIDLASPDDMWFHINGDSSAHVIANIPDTVDRKQIKYIVKLGGVLFKQISRHKSEKKTEIIYTQVKNVQKTDTIGAVHCVNTKIVTI